MDDDEDDGCDGVCDVAWWCCDVMSDVMLCVMLYYDDVMLCYDDVMLCYDDVMLCFVGCDVVVRWNEWFRCFNFKYALWHT